MNLGLGCYNPHPRVHLSPLQFVPVAHLDCQPLVVTGPSMGALPPPVTPFLPWVGRAFICVKLILVPLKAQSSHTPLVSLKYPNKNCCTCPVSHSPATDFSFCHPGLSWVTNAKGFKEEGVKINPIPLTQTSSLTLP